MQPVARVKNIRRAFDRYLECAAIARDTDVKRRDRESAWSRAVRARYTIRDELAELENELRQSALDL